MLNPSNSIEKVKTECMGKEKAIVKISTTSLERVSNQISIVNKILSKRQVRISPTRSTPQVFLDKEGNISISGRSIPDDALFFFKPIEEWISKYLSNPSDVTRVDINLEIINADSIKFLAHIIQKISDLSLKHKIFLINWYYEDGDEEILEIGKSFSSSLEIPFNFIKII